MVLLTVLPLAGQMYIPDQVLKLLSSQSGFDLIQFLDRLSLVGIVFASLVILRSHTERTSFAGLILSFVNKAFWFVVVLFALGLGYPETGGMAVLGGGGDGARNFVTIDLRLFALLVAVILGLMAVRSLLIYKEQAVGHEILSHQEADSGGGDSAA